MSNQERTKLSKEEEDRLSQINQKELEHIRYILDSTDKMEDRMLDEMIARIKREKASQSK